MVRIEMHFTRELHSKAKQTANINVRHVNRNDRGCNDTRLPSSLRRPRPARPSRTKANNPVRFRLPVYHPKDACTYSACGRLIDAPASLLSSLPFSPTRAQHMQQEAIKIRPALQHRPLKKFSTETTEGSAANEWGAISYIQIQDEDEKTAIPRQASHVPMGSKSPALLFLEFMVRTSQTSSLRNFEK
jgi:hypothetical protein